MRIGYLALIVLCVVGYHVVFTQLMFDISSEETSDDPANLQLEERAERMNQKLVEMQQQIRQIDQLGEEEQRDPLAELSPNDVIPAPMVNDRIPILLMACNRPDVSKVLDKVIKYRPSGSKFPIIVSQDCGDAKTAKAVQKYDQAVIHIKQPNLGKITDVPKAMEGSEKKLKISRHYRWALSEVFDALMYDQVIILEDNLVIAPDFFNYFEAMLPLLKKDPTLYCVSAFNDNGKPQYVKDNTALFRTDFFPGLGWMMTRELWKELAGNWTTDAIWDDWLRMPDQRKNRACIRPEISRTYVSGNPDLHFKHNALNKKPVDFLSTDIWPLIKRRYDDDFVKIAYEATALGIENLETLTEGSQRYSLGYRDNREFEEIANKIGLMTDFKSGVPRGAYLGIVPFRFKGNKMYLVPVKPWPGYQA